MWRGEEVRAKRGECKEGKLVHKEVLSRGAGAARKEESVNQRAER